VTEDNLQIRDIANIVGETIPNCHVEFAEGASPDKRCYKVNCNRLPQVLPRFQPHWNARRGAKELYEAYKKHGVTLEEFEGHRYKRIAHVHKLLQEGILDKAFRFKT
jgi:hypothetical protein